MSQSWAVVTGASAGLGVAFARRLASEGAGVILVARSADKLGQVAEELTGTYGVPTRVVPVDLSDRDARADLVAELRDTPTSHLINNAGFGTMGEFAEADPARITQELELNTVALTELTRAVVPGMIERGRGAIVNVASTGAFQPIPTMAVYAATKAYVLRFSIALWEELRPSGVRAIAICPGPTETSFFANAGNDAVMGHRRTPEQVVETTFSGLRRHRPYVVDGARNGALAFATRFAPAGLQASLARRVATH